ncbi:efflux RND transporter periplasmic adaptor subunit [Sinorhizobium mexicanum]|uniref:Efflux RND transporter periplasmic adaptor subunit n=1 Tax=Sinorhizobium mexicanum TaxID=375549 RepID=A0A859QHQ8_9HYPH|nr:efflux RND transporter periplasmic adaptor subunit [Sinorhizobium mexicanum]MBP1886338.1 Cu(I)/Ag(I) efflux system membrane fusion protein [Sinorhizobium mexicanum]QLL64054.1 efflux RND transporter periplasmic adaptor subunit [Sinorhizobium mexicanum]
MSRAGRTGLTLVAIVAAGAGGLWAGQRGVALPDLSWLRSIAGAESVAAAAVKAEPAGSGPIIYYRDPDGRPAYSATPRKTTDGRDFVAVGQGEDVSFDAAKAKPAEVTSVPAPGDKKILYYRNPMGLPDTSSTPKKDPMGMDYIPVYEGEGEDSSTVKVSSGKLQRTGVRTAEVGLSRVDRSIRVPGTVVIDERRINVVTMRADAFVEDVANVTTGDRVSKGQSLFRFFSKEVASAGAEFVTEQRMERSTDDGSGGALKLVNLGLSRELIAAIRRDLKVPSRISYDAPADGVVMERGATAGMMAKPGDLLFRIVDTSHMWVVADVPEHQLDSMRVGAEANVTVRSLPGKVFKGNVALIYPQIQEETRTAKVRIELPNRDGLLLANMYADVEINAGENEPVVAVPNSAIIDTGTRRIVFLDRGDGRFEPRDVKLGMRGEDRTEVTEGLKAGDRVVVAANFLLDAESNLNAALNALEPGEGRP